MQYLLVENKEIVHLGPIDYRPRFIQSELEEHELDFVISPTESGYVKINDSFELFPIGSVEGPTYDPVFEALSGPFWVYKDNEAHGTYSKVELDISNIKQNLKELAAKRRKEEEIKGFTLKIDDKDIFISTSREDRNLFLGISIPKGETLSWKFGRAGFVNLTQEGVDDIIDYRTKYIQNQFDTEHHIHNLIDDDNVTLESLKEIKKVWLTS